MVSCNAAADTPVDNEDSTARIFVSNILTQLSKLKSLQLSWGSEKS